MTSLLVEHYLNRLIFDDIERFMSVRDVPPGLSAAQLTPVPYVAAVDDIEIGFISLFRSTGPGKALALVIQYTVKVGGAVVLAMVRSPQNPAYGMLHYRKAEAEADLRYLRGKLDAPRDYKEMNRDDIDKFAENATGLAQKQIRITPK